MTSDGKKKKPKAAEKALSEGLQRKEAPAHLLGDSAEERALWAEAQCKLSYAGSWGQGSI